MAHEIYRIDGEDSMAYVSKVPWHGLGQRLPENADFEVWAKKAHLDWTVGESTVQYHIPNAGFRERPIPFSFDNHKVLYREDNFEPLSLVSKKYQVVQPIEILEFYRDLVELHGWEMHTAGSLDNGRRVWALAKMNKSLRIKGEDFIMLYALLTTSYDKTLSTTLMPTSVRVVCNNTLSIAYGIGEKIGLRIPHNQKFDADQVKLDAGIIDGSWEKFSTKAKAMADFHISKEFAITFFMNLMHDEAAADDYSDVIEGAKAKEVDSMINGFLNGPGASLESSKGTLWGLMNAVTDYVDHEKRAHSANNRFKSGQYGAGAALKRKVWNSIDEYMSVAA